ncbi:helix-turn-helix domain-containing protein [Baekduia soli]|uniref:helix-turn-helix domain-containing protein n=1 Tax=Baekduia soli TaxID=496014 RepID=UPI001652B5D1|nr:helix-turn-helix transcriptional regulator [Baekduia soli]
MSTGVPALDDVLGGLFWGDNVVWELDGASADPFYRAILRLEDAFDASTWIAVRGAPSRLVPDFPRLETVGISPEYTSIEPSDLLREIRSRCEAGKRNLLLFAPLDRMVCAWGAELTRGFFARCCPLLLDVGAIAYWSMDLRETPAAVQDTVEAVTQCVLHLDKHSVRVAKAEGRDPSVRGSLLHWHDEQEGPVLFEADVIGRVAASLRTLRRSRNITQRQLAQTAGVTSSAISQAERAERGLSLTTLVRLSSELGLTVDDLLHGEDPSTYQIGRRIGDPRRAPEPAITLLGGVGSEVRVDLVHLAARQAGAPIGRHSGRGIVAVSCGLVQVGLGNHTPTIRGGEVLVADCAHIDGWRNLGDREAVLFWIAIAERA